MSNDEDGVDIIFMPGCFDDFEGTQEELDNLIDYLTELANSGRLDEMAELGEIEEIEDEEIIFTPDDRTLN